MPTLAVPSLHLDENFWAEDSARLGCGNNHSHDLRCRGVITLAREDGADREVLRLCTHQPSTDVMESYTSFGWAKLCAQVSCIRIERVAQVVSTMGDSTCRSGSDKKSSVPPGVAGGLREAARGGRRTGRAG